ncbi:MAG: response regulator transcription factor [Betaproteobacteria bacterium]|nr:MAG: response regulator transcription factor [Betaproteobacteria bacterium]
MDISTPKLNGIEATRSILQRAPHAGIVMLSMHSTCRRW